MPDDLQSLIAALEDASAPARISAANALGTLGDPRAEGPLMAALEDDNPNVRSAAARALGLIGAAHEIDITPVVPLLADPDDSVREVAGSVLLGLAEKAVDALIGALNHRSSTVRGAAAHLLGELNVERARDDLYRVYYDDSSQWVRSQARKALDQLPPGERPWPQVRREQPAPDSPADTINLLRLQAAEWPSLHPSELPADMDKMTREQIQELLDKLDVRLANGDISEATYNRLVERWEARLRELDS